MREILFRGKRTDNGEWVYGYYVRLHDHNGNESHRIYTGYAETDCGDYYPDWFEVDPETVGRYTGLNDKNGKKIFEGDIIRYNTFNDFDCHSVVKFGEYEQDGSAGEYNPRDCIGWYVEVDNFTCPDWAEDDPIYFNDYLRQQNLFEVSDECEICEIIGNIWDNPELVTKNSAIDSPL